MRITGPLTLAGLSTALGILTCIASLIGLGGQFWWVFELASHFRPQYVLILSLCLPLLLFQRHYRWAVVFGLFILLNSTLLAPRLVPRVEATTHSEVTQPTFRVLLANINFSNRDYSQIRRSILEYQPDFIVLLEATPWLLEQLSEFAAHYPHRIAVPQEDPFGIALLSRHPFARTEIIRLGPAELPSIIAEIVANQQRFTVLGTHPPPPINAESAQDRNAQLTDLAAFVRQAQQPLLLLGDLNLSPWSPYFERLLTTSGLHDSAEGRGILPTWPVGLPLLWIPIDHVLFSNGIQILHRETGSALGSDHYPVIVDFQIIHL